MNKKIIGVLGLVVLISVAVISAVLTNITPQEKKSLSSKNNICEYYQNEFSIGETDSINVNGETLNIEYLGNKNWKINDYEGELKNHNFFVYNEKERLKGVRFDFGYMDQHQPEGNLGLRELDYYPWDCQGYSQSTGFISEIKIHEGWNLVPLYITLRDCYYALEGELCKDDILVSYIYIPTLNKYFTEEELENEVEKNSDLYNFLNDETNPTSRLTSKWIYVKPGAGDKKSIGEFGASVSHRDQYLESRGFKLERGWNFLFVDAFMIYDDDWSENPLSLNELKGDCNIEKFYMYVGEGENSGWTENMADFLSDKSMDDDWVGEGFIIKVSDNCNLGKTGGSSTQAPPQIPNSPGLPVGDSGGNNEACSTNELYNPYSEVCVGKDVSCNLNADCLLLVGQTASFSGESLTFKLISASEGHLNSLGYDEATINVGGSGEVNLMNNGNNVFSTGDYNILFESADGDQDKIMGASFEVSKE